nr:MAG TPA: hypothetical protein [Caudoviricetes sp.]
MACWQSNARTSFHFYVIYGIVLLIWSYFRYGY